MEKIWFTSDHHWGHTNIVRLCNRPFADIEEMNETLIANWNRVVGDKDMVYHLGDIFLNHSTEARAIRHRLKGNICLIRGNHDGTADTLKNCFAWIKDYYELKVTDKDAEGDKQRIVLCHYAFRVWNKAHHGAWNLYGHSHGSLPDDPNALSCDVGVDCHAFTPISYEQIKVIMATKSFQAIDHHGGRGGVLKQPNDPDSLL